MFDYFTLNNLIQFAKILCNIVIVWAAFYFILKIVKNNSRTIQIFKGILLIFLIKALAGFFGLNAVEYLADIFVQYGPIAIFIIFQPELRALLERIGKTNVFSRISTLTLNERERLVDELVKACAEMSKTKTGALISLEQGHSLNDFIKTGTPMNSVVTSELLCSIFVPGTPLHDGAVILQGVKIACAAAYFPPTTQDLPTMYGARHRAAVGISEITDSITIIVSEETGNISIAEGGKLSVVSEKSLRDFLTMVICQTQSEVVKEKIKKENDLEKDVDTSEKEKTAAEEKNGRISSLFRGKNKTEKNKGEKKKFTKTIKIDEEDARMEAKRNEQKVEKIGIANLVEESMPLDHLFDSIVSDSEAKKEAPKKQSSILQKVKEESEEQRHPVQNARQTDTSMKKVPTPKEERNEQDAEKKKARKMGASIRRKARNVEETAKTTQLVSTEKTVNKSVVKRAKRKDADALLDDVIAPEAIVLNYKDAKSQDTSSKGKKKEGSDR
ncbi:MAG: TIGR00159 family protein [Erysipelotrichaceae bacterium]|nr:TIGR00159 family protein [Erysipelotrichaceae bacterium]